MTLHYDGRYERLSGPSELSDGFAKKSDMKIGFLVKQKAMDIVHDAFYGIDLVLVSIPVVPCH